MDNVCRACGRKFLSDLKFCPHCGGEAMPPRTKSWHYRAPGMIAHTDPIEEKEERAYRQNGWVMLCLGILLIPMWLLGLDEFMDELKSSSPYLLYILLFVVATVVLALVFMGAVFAFQARRPWFQILPAFLIVVILNGWNISVWIVTFTIFVILLVLWAKGGGSKYRSDPTFLPLMSGLALFSVLQVFLWGMSSTMGLPV